MRCEMSSKKAKNQITVDREKLMQIFKTTDIVSISKRFSPEVIRILLSDESDCETRETL